MKKLLALAMLAFAGVAFASTTITLPSWLGFGALHQYHKVRTVNPATAITMYLPQYTTGSQTMQLYFEHQYDYVRNQFNSYWTGTYSGTGLVSVLQKCVFAIDADGNDIVPCQLNGQTLLLTLNETTYRTCTNQGRGQHCVRHWVLQSGTVIK